MATRWTLDDLRIFCSVVDVGSFTAAADAVGLSLSAVSARMKALDGAFGTELFFRSRTGVELTAAGRRLEAHARDLLEKSALVSEDIASFGTEARGLVRLVANTTAVTEHLPEILAAFLEAHSRVDVSLVEAVSADVLKQVRDGQAEIGIFTPGPPVGDMVTFAFRLDRLAVIVARQHPLATRETIDFAETLLANHVCLQQSAALYRFLRQRARDQGRHLKGRIHVAGFDAIARLVGRGVGIGVIPESAARRLEHGHGLRVLRLAETWADNALHICLRDRDSLSPSAQALLDGLQPGERLPSE